MDIILFKLKDADVQSLDFDTEYFSDNYCETCRYEWEIEYLVIGIDNDTHKFDLDNTGIIYSDIMSMVLNGLNFFEQLTADEFIHFLENYIQYRADQYEEPLMDFSDEGTYWKLFNNGVDYPSRW